MNWQRKKVLVTGAGGFIGSHMVERLVELGAPWGLCGIIPGMIQGLLELVTASIKK